jgi:thiamine-phosphate pyrophosphorylase
MALPLRGGARFDPRLHLVVDPSARGPAGTAALVRTAVAGGVTVVQMRQKDGSTRELVDAARRLVAELRPAGVPLIVNDRADVAVAAGADGVHVGQDDMTAADVRRIVGAQAIVGLSVWALEQLAEATPGVVDYVGVGPVFATTGKSDAVAPIGLDGVAAIALASAVPVVAIGGISVENAASVARAGADGLAVISAIVSSADALASATALRQALEDGRGVAAGARG